MKLPLKLDQLVFVVPIFSLQMLFQFFLFFFDIIPQSSHLLNANWILARPENLSPPMCIFAPPALTFLIFLLKLIFAYEFDEDGGGEDGQSFS